MIAEVGLMGAGFTGDKVRIADDFHNTANWERQAMLSSIPDDPWVTTGIPVTTGWHTFRIFRTSPATAGFQVDATLETTTSNVPTSNLPVFLMSYGNTNQLAVDWVRVRRWCGSEPTLEFAAEQSSPTAVTVSSFYATSANSAILLQWQTASEVDLVGFNLYRSTSSDGELERLNANIIPAKVPGGLRGADYEFIDDLIQPGETYYYWLEPVEVGGPGEKMGPMIAAAPRPLFLPLLLQR